MSFFRLPSFISGKSRVATAVDVAGDAGPTLSLHVPTFGGLVMKPLLDLTDGAFHEPTILAGQVEIHQPEERGLMCNGISVWIEARWTDIEGQKEKGSSVCFEQKAKVDCTDQGPIWLQPGRQR
jgi:hypothetical protein